MGANQVKGLAEALKAINLEIKIGPTAPENSSPTIGSHLWVCSNPVPGSDS